MSETYRFKPKKDITARELAEIIEEMRLAFGWSIYSSLSIESSRHFEKEKEND